MQKFRLARSARSQPLMGFSRVSGKFLVGINRHEQDHKIITCYEHKDTVPTSYVIHQQNIEKNRMFQTHTKNWLARNHYRIAFSRVSGRYVKHFSDAKVQKFWLALSARSISFISSFLFCSQYNEQDHITSVTNTVMDILHRQTVIYQQCIH